MLELIIGLKTRVLLGALMFRKLVKALHADGKQVVVLGIRCTMHKHFNTSHSSQYVSRSASRTSNMHVNKIRLTCMLPFGSPTRCRVNHSYHSAVREQVSTSISH